MMPDSADPITDLDDEHCAVCDGSIRVVRTEMRGSSLVEHYRCDGECPDLGGHVKRTLDGSPFEALGPVFSGKNELLVADAVAGDGGAAGGTVW